MAESPNSVLLRGRRNALPLGKRKKNTDADGSRGGWVADERDMEVAVRTWRPFKLFYVNFFVRQHGGDYITHTD